MKLFFCSFFIFFLVLPLYSIDLDLLAINQFDFLKKIQTVNPSFSPIQRFNYPENKIPLFVFNGQTGPTDLLWLSQGVNFKIQGKVQFLLFLFFLWPNNGSRLAFLLQQELELSAGNNVFPNFLRGGGGGLSSGENFDGLNGKSVVFYDENKGISNPIPPADNRFWIYNLRYQIGDVACFIQSGRNNCDLVPILDSFVKVIHNKRILALSLDQIEKTGLQGISQQGIQKSLQVKLDNFKKHFLKGEYDVALNMLNSFLNELSAQRGKHVPEVMYQTLKTQADSMIQSVNFLINLTADPSSTPTNQPKK